MSETKPPSGEELLFERVEEFVAAYANNVQFQSSAWDLKMIFGELGPTKDGKTRIEQHTSITLAWPEAKMLSYYLQVQLAIHEIEDGKIALPARVLPEEPQTLSPELQTNPQARLARETVLKIREQFLASLK